MTNSDPKVDFKDEGQTVEDIMFAAQVVIDLASDCQKTVKVSPEKLSNQDRVTVVHLYNQLETMARAISTEQEYLKVTVEKIRRDREPGADLHESEEIYKNDVAKVMKKLSEGKNPKQTWLRDEINKRVKTQDDVQPDSPSQDIIDVQPDSVQPDSVQPDSLLNDLFATYLDNKTDQLTTTTEIDKILDIDLFDMHENKTT